MQGRKNDGTQQPKDYITAEVVNKFRIKMTIDACYDNMAIQRSDAHLKLIMPAQWWRDELRVCGYFGFDIGEIEYAKTSSENYLGTKNGFDCYVRPKS